MDFVQPRSLHEICLTECVITMKTWFILWIYLRYFPTLFDIIFGILIDKYFVCWTKFEPQKNMQQSQSYFLNQVTISVDFSNENKSVFASTVFKVIFISFHFISAPFRCVFLKFHTLYSISSYLLWYGTLAIYLCMRVGSVMKCNTLILFWTLLFLYFFNCKHYVSCK